MDLANRPLAKKWLRYAFLLTLRLKETYQLTNLRTTVTFYPNHIDISDPGITDVKCELVTSHGGTRLHVTRPHRALAEEDSDIESWTKMSIWLAMELDPVLQHAYQELRDHSGVQDVDGLKLLIDELIRRKSMGYDFAPGSPAQGDKKPLISLALFAGGLAGLQWLNPSDTYTLAAFIGWTQEPFSIDGVLKIVESFLMGGALASFALKEFKARIGVGAEIPLELFAMTRESIITDGRGLARTLIEMEPHEFNAAEAYLVLLPYKIRRELSQVFPEELKARQQAETSRYSADEANRRLQQVLKRIRQEDAAAGQGKAFQQAA
jgi:hypothetical protein